jgi:SulP family sulfate permease
VIVGCIGGIGVFLFLTGVEGSTNKAWEWDSKTILEFFAPAVLPLWLTSLAFEILLRILSYVTKYSLLPPFFFMAIPPTFYLLLLLSGVPVETAHENGWFFKVCIDVCCYSIRCRGLESDRRPVAAAIRPLRRHAASHRIICGLYYN